MAKLKIIFQGPIIERTDLRSRFYSFMKDYAGYDDLVAIILIIIGGLFYWNNGPIPYHEGLHNFYENIHIDLISIGITVMIIGNATEAVSIGAEKRRLILQMGSPDNAFAIEAVRQLAQRYWLYYGSVKGAYLENANLEGAHLWNAHLEQAILSKAHLEGANLNDAHLKGAYLENANLEGADLWNAHLEGAWLIEAHLKGADLKRAHMEGACLVMAHLEGADLREAHLVGTDLRWANLEGATYNNDTNWENSHYTKGENGTIWPNENFDPEANEYRTVSTEPIPVTIEPGEAEESTVTIVGTDKQPIAILSGDIRHIKPVPTSLRSVDVSMLTSSLYWACWLAPALVVGGVWIWQRRRQRFAADKAYARRQTARRTARQILSDAEQAGTGSYALVQRALLGYLSDKLNYPTVGLTADSLTELLRAAQLEPVLIDKVHDILAQTDIGRFAPIEETAARSLVADTRRLIDELEKVWGRGW